LEEAGIVTLTAKNLQLLFGLGLRSRFCLRRWVSRSCQQRLALLPGLASFRARPANLLRMPVREVGTHETAVGSLS